MTDVPKNTIYFFGKVSEALNILATGSEDIKDRLIGAGDIFLCAHPDDVPEELRYHVQWVREQLTRFKATGNEGDLRATMRRIRKNTGVMIAKRMVYIYYCLRSYVEQSEDYREDCKGVISEININLKSG